MPKKLLFAIVFSLSLVALAVLVRKFWSGGDVFLDSTSLKDGTASFISESPVMIADRNVTLWQTKETGYFTIRFPKEWHWVDVSPDQIDYRFGVITNDRNFDSSRLYSERGFSVQPEEILIAFNGGPTVQVTEVGKTDEDIIKQFLENQEKISQKKGFVCERQLINGMEISHCILSENGQSCQEYAFANKKDGIILSVYSNKESSVDEEIIKDIVKNFQLSQ